MKRDDAVVAVVFVVGIVIAGVHDLRILALVATAATTDSVTVDRSRRGVNFFHDQMRPEALLFTVESESDNERW